MNKKLISLLVLLIIILFILIVLVKTNVIHISDSFFTKPSPSSLKNENTKIKVSKVAKIDKKAIAHQEFINTDQETVKQIAQNEKEWLKSINSFFNDAELNYSLTEYIELREQYYGDYLEAYDKFMLSQTKKKGGANPTQENIQMKKIKKKYHQKLLKSLGEKGYTRFLEIRDDFNQRQFFTKKNRDLYYLEF